MPPKIPEVMLCAGPDGDFLVRLVRKGENWGANFKLTLDAPEAEPMVEFYDTRYHHTPLGQFVARYNLSTFTDHQLGMGLCLNAGDPSWNVGWKEMEKILKWLKERTTQ